MLRRICLLFPFIFLFLFAEKDTPNPPFLVQPYVQLGNAPSLSDKEQLLVLWHTVDVDAKWHVDYRVEGKGWKKADVDQERRIEVSAIPAHRVFSAHLKDLAPGKPVSYRVSLEGKQVFEVRHGARKAAIMEFAALRDCAADAEQRAIAYQTYQAKPDFVAIAGDIVYSRGLISEYRQKYYPVYNNDSASKMEGAPLIRSTLFMAAPGNHDVGGSDLEKTPDGLAYYLYWAQPLNGPSLSAGATPLLGPDAQKAAFHKAAGKQFPRMANFSFDYGNSHWTVIDSNKYAEWTLPELRDWLKKDLAGAKNAKWRFVIFHHPGFNSSKAHFGDQWMRLVAPSPSAPNRWGDFQLPAIRRRLLAGMVTMCWTARRK